MGLLSIPEQVTALFTDLSVFALLAADLTMENFFFAESGVYDRVIIGMFIGFRGYGNHQFGDQGV